MFIDKSFHLGVEFLLQMRKLRKMGASQSTTQKPVSLPFEGLGKNADSPTTPWPTEFNALE